MPRFAAATLLCGPSLLRRAGGIRVEMKDTRSGSRPSGTLTGGELHWLDPGTARRSNPF